MWPFQSGTRGVLIAGFGGLLILMLVAGVDALNVVRNLRNTNAQIRQRFLTRNAALEQIRSGIFLSATYVRDYLLAPEPSGAAAQRARLAAIEKETETALQEYSNSLDPAESAPFVSLRGEIYAYWKLLDLILNPSGDVQRRSGGYTYFYRELIRRRTAMLDIADRISDVNERELNTGDQRIAEAFNRFRVSLVATLAVTLAGGLLLATVTIAHMLRLEAVAKLRYEESVRTQAELKELSASLVNAQEQERKAIARELHDEVGQSLSALLVETGNTTALLPPASDDLRRHLESIKHLAESSVNVIRNMSLLLRPSMLDDLGLVPALEWQAREVSKRTGLRVRVSADESADNLPDEHKTCIYRVVQEALHNCARHAQARGVDVVVRDQPEKILLTIADDGHGFEARQVRGLGLLGMEERVTHLGGSFEVNSQTGQGTQVKVELPINGYARQGA
jgi:signal transduction histidine kinase